MENANHADFLTYSLFFVFGFICLVVSGAIKIKEADSESKNKVAYYVYGTGELAIFFSIYYPLCHISQGLTATSLLAELFLELLLLPFVSIVLSTLISAIIGIWVHRKNPKATFPPPRGKQTVTTSKTTND